MLAALPGGHCECPHWGYLFRGRMIVHYPNRDEVIEEGQAFYMPPGHVPTYEVGTQLTQFSPTEELKATEAAIMRNLQQLQAT